MHDQTCEWCLSWSGVLLRGPGRARPAVLLRGVRRSGFGAFGCANFIDCDGPAEASCQLAQEEIDQRGGGLVATAFGVASTGFDGLHVSDVSGATANRFG